MAVSGRESEIEGNFPLNTRPIVGVTKEKEVLYFPYWNLAEPSRSCSDVTRLGGAPLGAAVVPR